MLNVDQVEQRENRWVVGDLEARGAGRTVLVPVWVKNAIDAWLLADMSAADHGSVSLSERRESIASTPLVRVHPAVSATSSVQGQDHGRKHAAPTAIL